MLPRSSRPPRTPPVRRRLRVRVHMRARVRERVRTRFGPGGRAPDGRLGRGAARSGRDAGPRPQQARHARADVLASCVSSLVVGAAWRPTVTDAHARSTQRVSA
eukprot:5242894-Pleurochrysis_carterae.AAC.3